MAIRHTIINGSQKVWLARVAYQGRWRVIAIGGAEHSALRRGACPR